MTREGKTIVPSILGTLFERSLDPSKRAQLGAHYTSREDILDVVEPVLMAPLRRRWAEVRQQAEKLGVSGTFTDSGGGSFQMGKQSLSKRLAL